MTLDEIITIADEAYPDGLVGMWHAGSEPGDTLAKFIAVELKDTYYSGASSEAQLREALRVMETARDQLNDVIAALEDAYDQRRRERA